MQQGERKSYIRLIYRRAFKYLGVMLVLSLLLGALLGAGVYMVYSVCAMGFVMICWGWFTYLKMAGMRPFGTNPNKKKVKIPYIHRRFKEKKHYRPSFRMDSDDFDDDLTSATVVNEENFTEKQVDAARAISRVMCGAIMVIISFFMPLGG
ncbi:MAG: hypothetical protein IJO48_06285 [Clostridia bacterium]|nr:hypothetical protein [Clostridia bacterium]